MKENKNKLKKWSLTSFLSLTIILTIITSAIAISRISQTANDQTHANKERLSDDLQKENKDQKLDLDTLITNKSLGVIRLKNINKEYITDKLNLLNKNHHLDLSQLSYNRINFSNVTISAKQNSNNYKREVKISFIPTDDQTSDQDINNHKVKLTAEYDQDDTICTKIGYFTNDNKEIVIEKFKETVVQVPEFLPEYITSLAKVFESNQNQTIKGIEAWDTSNVTDFSKAFFIAKKFNQALTWDTSKAKDMRSMFQGALAFNSSLGDKFDTSNVTNMWGMFQQATSFNQSLGDKFDTSKVTNMAAMFNIASSFNQSLGDKFVLNIKDPKNYKAIFWSAKSFNQDLSHWELPVDNIREFMAKHVRDWEDKNLPLSITRDTNLIAFKNSIKNFLNQSLQNKIVAKQSYKDILEVIKQELNSNFDNVESVELMTGFSKESKITDLDPEGLLNQKIRLKINNRIGLELDLKVVK
ncbi:BspA family leucine-rich repeat surface protein [Mycoplasma putrefaciens]|uniref:Uncharacterized protein n=1 Tax=Mycoplasma putrefaciens Mput9231 TaxID=1292033 RepID=M9WCI6_9MOLU|nr:BspA family leucine-rich repeat surface protein [Mycoplasma putrefaciens]AGJ90536.1 Hypothetical protein, DUF285 family [Mycoplasma putrefaciens Mput9231]